MCLLDLCARNKGARFLSIRVFSASRCYVHKLWTSLDTLTCTRKPHSSSVLLSTASHPCPGLPTVQTIHPTVLWERLTHGVLYPTVTMEETDGLGSSQFTPICFVVHPIPSHCTITANGQTGIIPRHPIGYTLSPLSIVLSPCTHSAGCLLCNLFITLRCYHNKSIYYHCENDWLF